MEKCKRIVVFTDEVKVITTDHHRFAYSGKIPCTGPQVCIYCGKHKEEKEVVSTEERNQIEEAYRSYTYGFFENIQNEVQDHMKMLDRGKDTKKTEESLYKYLTEIIDLWEDGKVT